MISKISSHLGPGSIFSGGVVPSLVLHLDGSSYDGSASYWYDLTAFNNHISMSNVGYTSTWQDLSQFPGSLLFDGTSSFGTIISGTAIPIDDSHYTIESWIQSDTTSGNRSIVGWGNYGSNGQVNGFRLYDYSPNNFWWYNDLLGTPGAFSTNYFYHVAVTYNGTSRTIYFNGEQLNIDTPGAHSVPYFNNLTVGLTELALSEYFDGNIAELKIWNKSLSSTQVLNSFNNNKSKFGYDYGSLVLTNYSSSPHIISSSSDFAFGLGDFTIEAFFKLYQAVYYGYGGVVSLRGLSSNTDGVNINLQQINTATPLVEFSVGGSFITHTVSNDKWYHAAVSRSSGTSSVYINGALISQLSDSTNYTNNDLVIGRYYTDADNHYMEGLVSNVRVVNGTGIYSGMNISVPTTYPLGLTGSDTKLLIVSQEIEPDLDASIYQQATTASNIGWTSSLPEIFEFNYVDFSSTSGLQLIGVFNVISNQIWLTNTTNSDVGNVWRTDSTNFNRNFSLEWNFECGGGSGADGFCVQWHTSNSGSGGSGGDVGAINGVFPILYSSINLFQFKTYTYNDIRFWHNGAPMDTQTIGVFTFRQNVYYWLDYNHATSTVYIYYSTTNTKPGSPNHTFTSVTFDSSNYYLGFGAACGGSNDNHILKSMKLTFL